MSGAEATKQWKITGEDYPWFDRKDALEVLESRWKQGRYTDLQCEAFGHWIVEGYVVLHNLIPEQQIDGMLGDMDQLWTTDTAIPDLEIMDLQFNPQDPLGRGFKHSRLVGLDRNTRERLKQNCHWRIHGFYRFSSSAAQIFFNSQLIEWTSLIFDRTSSPRYTINFTYGSGQSLHQDMSVFHLWPPNYLIGAWLACEDIHPESGPLVFYPRSHRDRMFAGFDNYPQTNLRTCNLETTKAYEEHIRSLSHKYEKQKFLAKRETFCCGMEC